MLYFENDYCEGAHPAILQKLTETNFEKVSGYGTDPYCASAKAKICAACGCPDVTTAVVLEVGFDLFGFLQHGGKFGLFGFVKAIVADTQHPEAVCQKRNHCTEIAFPMAAGTR